MRSRWEQLYLFVEAEWRKQTATPLWLVSHGGNEPFCLLCRSPGVVGSWKNGVKIYWSLVSQQQDQFFMQVNKNHVLGPLFCQQGREQSAVEAVSTSLWILWWPPALSPWDQHATFLLEYGWACPSYFNDDSLEMCLDVLRVYINLRTASPPLLTKICSYPEIELQEVNGTWVIRMGRLMREAWPFPGARTSWKYPASHH